LVMLAEIVELPSVAVLYDNEMPDRLEMSMVELVHTAVSF